MPVHVLAGAAFPSAGKLIHQHRTLAREGRIAVHIQPEGIGPFDGIGKGFDRDFRTGGILRQGTGVHFACSHQFQGLAHDSFQVPHTVQVLLHIINLYFLAVQDETVYEIQHLARVVHFLIGRGLHIGRTACHIMVCLFHEQGFVGPAVLPENGRQRFRAVSAEIGRWNHLIPERDDPVLGAVAEHVRRRLLFPLRPFHADFPDTARPGDDAGIAKSFRQTGGSNLLPVATPVFGHDAVGRAGRAAGDDNFGWINAQLFSIVQQIAGCVIQIFHGNGDGMAKLCPEDSGIPYLLAFVGEPITDTHGVQPMLGHPADPLGILAGTIGPTSAMDIDECGLCTFQGRVSVEIQLKGIGPFHRIGVSFHRHTFRERNIIGRNFLPGCTGGQCENSRRYNDNPIHGPINPILLYKHLH